jgi:hypothetical protein
MPKHPTQSQSSQGETSSASCGAYYAHRCDSCPRYRVYCKGSSGFCVCSERCPVCCKPILFSIEKHWLRARLTAWGFL